MRFALCVLFLVACSSDPLVFLLPTSFEPRQQVDVFGSADRWNEYADRDHRIEWSPNGDWVIAAHNPKNGFAGWTSRSRRVVLISAPPGESVKRVAAHEFGHVLGIDGHPVRHGVMSELPTSEEITDEDVGACRDVGACP